MLADLVEALAPECPLSLLMVFAFDGFNEYEELHGVIDGRKLLRRLADRLAAVLDESAPATARAAMCSRRSFPSRPTPATCSAPRSQR